MTNFSNVFSGCKNIASIPSGLFDHTTNVTDFSYVFGFCIALQSIPNGLFDNNTAVTSFSNAFSNCQSLQSIPAGLFNNNTAVTDFSGCFSGCSSLQLIPAGLFNNNIAATNFSSCFSGCNMLKLNSNIFCDEETEKTTRFTNVNQQMQFSYCFYIDSFTGEKGTSPALWEYTYSTTPYSYRCFNINTIDSQITNAADVPTEWKQ